MSSDDDDDASESSKRGEPASETFDVLLRDIARSDPIDPPSKDDLAGSSLGHYRILEELGRGGMGIVYRAEDARLAREVALKVLPVSRADHDERRRRFLREARSAAAINHPNIATIYEVGEADGRLFLAMERVDGSTLRARLAASPLGEGEALRIARQIALGLAQAHAKGIVHRDLKPENVMLTREGVVKILDFGLAKLREPLSGDEVPPSGSTLTLEGHVMGTPGYMSPEQATGKPVDRRTDVYALGVVLHEMLTGELPGALGSGRVAANPGAAAIVTRCLARATEDRWEGAGEVVAALDALSRTGDEAPARTGSRRDSAKPARISFAGVKRAWSGHGNRIALGLVALAALAAGTATYRAAHSPHVSYCVATIDSIEGKSCVFPSVEGPGRRLATARVTEIGGRVSHMEALNAAGYVADDPQAMFADLYGARIDIARCEDGAVRDVVLRDSDGLIVRWERWSESGRRVDFVDVDGASPRHGADDRVTTIRRDFDGSGLVARERYFGVTGRPRPDGQGAYGYEFLHGSHGHSIRETVLAADGKPGALNEGLSRVDVSDDAETPLGRDRYNFDVEGHPLAVEGVWHDQALYDGARAIVGNVHLGLRDDLVFHLRSGDAERRYVYDWTAGTMTFSFLDPRGRPSVFKHGFNAGTRWYFGSHGRVTRTDFLDKNGNLVAPRGWEASIEDVFDDRDRIAEQRYLDSKGAPMMDVGVGSARQTFVRDEHGLAIEIRSFDEEDHPASANGGAVQRFPHDDRDLKLAAENYDASGRRVVDASGVWSHAMKYDRLRNLVERTVLGIDGRPTSAADGTSIDRWTYDENDDLVAESHFDAAGAPLMLRGEYATRRLVNDERGLVLEEHYLDSHGEPTLCKEGWATARYLRDRNGDVTEEAYFGKHDEPILRSGLYAKKRNVYDLHRRRIESSLYDASGVPTIGADGWSIERVAYEERGLVIREDHFDAGGAPVLGKSGSASRASAWDERGNRVEETTLGIDGKPVATKSGYATTKSVYDEGDELTEESLFGADGEPVAGDAGWSIHKQRYDDFGNVVEEAWFDADRKAVAPKGGSFASVQSRFDARQRLAETSWFDAGGAPASGPDGVATVRYKRDAYGRAIETDYLDGAGVPAASKGGKLVVRSMYDGAGRLQEEHFVDAAGAPRAASDGCAAHRTKYDPQGRKVEESCLGVNDASVYSVDGWAIRRTLHDARGNDVDVATFAPDGALHAGKDGIARRKSRFDERNLLLETAYFGANDRPARDARGAHAIRFTYDDAGNKTGERPVAEETTQLPRVPDR